MMGSEDLRIFFRWMWVPAMYLLVGARVMAQEDAVPTLHAYTNTIQIPVLVLGASYERIKPIAADRFSVRLDSGPWFRASHVRVEGDDPITLSVLLDVSGDVQQLLPKMSDALADLVPGSLHAQDQVSIYAMDCGELKSVLNVPPDPESVRVAVDWVLGPWRMREVENGGPTCERTGRLWDALAYVADEMHRSTGRRVILAVTDGDDEGSTRTWIETKTLASSSGVAVFGMRWRAKAIGRDVVQRWSREDAFLSLCELSGGIVRWVTPDGLGAALPEFVTQVRERYIVEFPRPYKSTAGVHDLEVRVDKSRRDIIRPAGIAVPLPDAAVMTDPSTVPNDPARTPELGNRRVLAAPR